MHITHGFQRARGLIEDACLMQGPSDGQTGRIDVTHGAKQPHALTGRVGIEGVAAAAEHFQLHGRRDELQRIPRWFGVFRPTEYPGTRRERHFLLF